MQSGTLSYHEFSALMKRRAYAEAVSLAERQSVAAGNRSEFWLTQLSVALRESGKFRDAFDTADKACAIAPGSAWPLLARAEALLKQGDADAALADFEAAERDDRVALRARKGLLQCLAQSKSWERMLSFLAQWELPQGVSCSWRVRALMGLGRTDEANSECRRWLEEDPENPEALWKLVEMQVVAEGVEPVRQRMERMAKIPGKSAVYGEIYASLCKQSGSMHGAAEQYEKLLKQERSPALLRKQAFALAKSGSEERAIPLMEELLRLSPDDMYLNAAYVPACKRLGQISRAWTFYHELLALHPDRKTIFGRIKRVSNMLENPPGESSAASTKIEGNRAGPRAGRKPKQ